MVLCLISEDKEKYPLRLHNSKKRDETPVSQYPVVSGLSSGTGKKTSLKGSKSTYY